MNPREREEAIAKLAYTKWEQAGSRLEDSTPYWLEAEQEFRAEEVRAALLEKAIQQDKARIGRILLAGIAAIITLVLLLILIHHLINPVAGWVEFKGDQIAAKGTGCTVQSDHQIVRCKEFDMVVAKPLGGGK